MLTTILKEDVQLTMDPDSCLNRAHQKERQAERLLNIRRYEEASECYCKAAELIKDAMSTTQDPSALFSLKLQYESNLKQPLIIKRRQEENLRKIESVTQSPPWTNKWKMDQNVPLIPYETSDTIQTLTSESSNLPTPTNGSSEIIDERFSLEEAFNSLEETRPLLECLRQHTASPGERSEYFAGALLENYDQKPHPEDDAEQKVFINGRKMPKGDQMIIEELQMQNKELCQHIVRLLQNMDHCERENQQLKSRIEILEQDLETLKSQSSSEEASLKEDLAAPFSLPVTSNASSVTTPPAEIPPLPPLELPNFDVN